ncbi:putative extracellular protein [Aspergillus mulundensis]|uniref:Extracellular protein n=1 Tax=Aspergillus mulundensis TaxID=1810919 RepID=A0A3D8SU36_9EURO|nr:hypothetical protein DSM5745_01570 [Aspergillus mulundensis]RDW89795.1 hypothetical protein DSM5745_01570 [Aspergillus mulundensis]
MQKFFLTAALLASSAYGHIQMSNPYPIRSPLNAANAVKDYSYTNPLSTSGSDFPCKGYQNDPFTSVATYSPGQTYNLELAGSATHGGGSCQISLSYDNGATFQVIHSMLGGCPITQSYEFTIPTDAPSGEALLAWTWFNKIGNREMYMNCAQVTVESPARKEGLIAVSKRDAFSSLPPIFIANVNGPGQCTTIEGQEVNFPLPGPSVEGSLTGTGYTCSGTAPFLGTSMSPNSGVSSSGTSATAASSSSSSSSTPLTDAPLTSSAAASSSPSPDPVSSPESSPVATSGEVAPTESPQLPDDAEDTPCVPGTIICSEDGGSWSLCDQGSPVPMGNVAAGTICTSGAIKNDPMQ